MRKFFVSMAMGALASLPAISNASVTYTFQAFSSYSGPIKGSFTYASPDFITAARRVFASAMTSCDVTSPAGASCDEAVFYVDSSFLPVTGQGDNYDVVAFGTSLGIGAYYYFQNHAFDAAGVYESQVLGTDQQGRLTVTTSAVPEPSTAAMMLIGTAFGVTLRFARRSPRRT